MTERPLQFGDAGRVFGVFTAPDDPPPVTLPAFVFLSAGLLHRVGPSRLHVRLARRLCRDGMPSIRFDISGKGDSLPRPGLGHQEAVALDYAAAVAAMERFWGDRPRVLVGMCSGADNAVRLSISDPRVVGMVLLDPIAFPDAAFHARRVVQKLAEPSRYVAWTLRTVGRVSGNHEAADTFDALALRELPSDEQMRAAVGAIAARGGRMLSIFTQYAKDLGYYNIRGQLGRAVGPSSYEAFATELFWPDVHHTYRLEAHRQRLMDQVVTWTRSLVTPAAK